MILSFIFYFLLWQIPDPKPIGVPQELVSTIENANKDMEIARLKKESIILQLRLLLKVPNEYTWDEPTFSFRPLKKDNKKE